MEILIRGQQQRGVLVEIDQILFVWSSYLVLSSDLLRMGNCHMASDREAVVVSGLYV